MPQPLIESVSAIVCVSVCVSVHSCVRQQKCHKIKMLQKQKKEGEAAKLLQVQCTRGASRGVEEERERGEEGGGNGVEMLPRFASRSHEIAISN